MNKKLSAWALFAVIKLNLNWLNLSKEFSFSAKTGTVQMNSITIVKKALRDSHLNPYTQFCTFKKVCIEHKRATPPFFFTENCLFAEKCFRQFFGQFFPARPDAQKVHPQAGFEGHSTRSSLKQVNFWIVAFLMLGILNFWLG